jgi:hypothetical protein
MMRWLEEKPEPRPGESAQGAERRQRWADRVHKGTFMWEVVLPVIALVAMCVVMAVRFLG